MILGFASGSFGLGRLPELFDIGSDVNRSQLVQFEVVLHAPMIETADRSSVAGPCVRVIDLGGEEFEEAIDGLVSGLREGEGRRCPRRCLWATRRVQR